MIELFLIYSMCKALGRRLRAKGQAAWPFQLMLAFGWFLGEFVGGFGGAIVSRLLWGPDNELPFAYIVAICLAVTVACLVFLFARLMPDKNAEPRAFPVQPLAAPAGETLTPR
jgi:hypothetical protein